MELSSLLSHIICAARRLRIEDIENIPSQGPALIATTHASPLDLFYCLAVMRRAGRRDHRFVVIAALLDKHQFRPYTRAVLKSAHPAEQVYAHLATTFGGYVVPRFFRGLDPIPIHRTGNDSETRRQVVCALLHGSVVTIAPEGGNDSHRRANGLRPITHGVASIARQYYDVTHTPLTVIPMAICSPRRPRLSQVRLRVGKPFDGMSAEHYPELFANAEQTDDTIKHQAYREYTQGLADRLDELS